MGRFRVASLALFPMAALAGPPPAHRVPLASAGDGHDTVPAYVDGKGPYPFILDTGADQSAVYPWFVDRASLRKVAGKDQDLSGQTGSARVSTYALRTVTLAGVAARGVEAYGLPARRDSGREAGVLGNDLMDRAIVAFDFPCRVVELRPRAAGVTSLTGPGHAPSVAGIDKGTTLLTLPVTINGAAGIAILDTGSRWTRLTPGFAKAAGLDTSSAAFHDADPFYGTSGHAITPRIGPIGRLAIGGHILSGVTAQVVALPVLAQDFGDRPAMLLGADILGRFRFVYDHAGRRVWFLPSRCTSGAGA